MAKCVFDAHVHFTNRSVVSYDWMGETPGLSATHEYTEAELVAHAAASGITITGAIFVEVGCNAGPAPDDTDDAAATLREARWMLSRAADPSSIVAGVVANIPVTQGGAAVGAWLDQLRDESGALPAALRGARNVLNGAPADALVDPTFIEGVRVLAANGLAYEICAKPHALAHVATLCQAVPDGRFVLDHLLYGGELAPFCTAIDAIAAGCPNLVAVKLGGIEEWEVDDPAPHIEHALRTLGLGRCVFEGNWFMSEHFKDGQPYAKTYDCVVAALEAVGATPAQVEDVLSNNAQKAYGVGVGASAAAL